MAKLDSIDCRNILLKANREIKCLNYELSAIVQSPLDQGVNCIYNRKPFDIEVLQESFMTFKASVRGQPSPAKFQVAFRENPDLKMKPDLRVYCSTHVKEPRENNCSKAFSNVSILTLTLIAHQIRYRFIR